MNASMRITITVAQRNAQALIQMQRDIQALQRTVAQLTSQNAALGASMSGIGGKVRSAFGNTAPIKAFGSAIGQLPHSMIKLGKDIQWTGRQLEFRFSLPLIAAGVAVTRWALANERAATRLVKVYGDLSMSQDEAVAQTNAMRKGWEALSNIFGVAQDEVIDIAATWAQAGSQGVGLMERTRLTIEAMIISELDAAKATQGLIVLTQAYGLSADELREALEAINVVENQTAAGTQDIIEVFEKAGGVAKTAGVSVRELASMTASLVPVAGSAAEAGTFLKTAIQSIMAPTAAGTAAMEAMGFAVKSAAWNSKTFTERLGDMSKVWTELTQPQKLQAARDLFGLRQASRGIILLDDMANAQGRYAQALEATADAAKNAEIMQREIELFLTSSPQGFQIAIQQMKNALTTVITPMLPTLVQLAKAIAGVFQAFNRLDPSTRNFIITMLALLAIAGPIIAYMGAFITLFGTLAKVVLYAGTAVTWLAARALPMLASMLGGLSLPVAAVVAALAVLGVLIWKYPEQVKNALKAMAQIFMAGFRAIVTIVTTAGKAIYKALQWINPFARHSPSLVEQVDEGIDFIVDKYRQLDGLGSSVHRAAAAFRDFLSATEGTRAAWELADFNALRDAVASILPEAVAKVDELRGAIIALRGELEVLEGAIDAQRDVVESWEDALDALDDEIDAANEGLEQLRDTANQIGDELAAARDRLSELSRTPIAGMGAMDDAIFENEMAIKRLKLAMLDLEEGNDTVSDMSDEFARLNGEIEMLRSKEKDLRMAGATADILAPFEGQIAALEAARDALQQDTGGGGGGNSQLEEMKKQLADLEKEGERLNLTKSINFDPLLRQIEKAVNGMEEMPFDAIIGGIQAEKANIERLEQAWDEANEAVKEQEQVIKDLQRQRKDAQRQLEAEQDTLRELEEQYRDIEEAIDDMASAMEDFGEKAKQALDDASAAGDGGALDVPGDFDVSGGLSGINDPASSLEEIQALVDAWIDEMNRGAKGPFDFIKEKWNEFKAWWSGSMLGEWSDSLVQFGGKIFDWFQGVDWNGIWQGMKDAGSSVVSFFDELWHNQLGPALDWVLEKMSNTWDAIVDAFGPVADELSEWGSVINDVWYLIQEGAELLWAFIGPFVTNLVKFFTDNWDEIWLITKQVWDTLWDIIKSTMDLIGGVIEGSLKVIRGTITAITGLIQGDWDKFWKGIGTILEGAWTMIESVVRSSVEIIWTIIKNAGDSIGAVWDLAWGGMKAVLRTAWQTMLNGVVGAINAIVNVINRLISGINWVISNVPGTGGLNIQPIGSVSAQDLPFYAMGGNLPSSNVGAGFVTNGPRAIVGEGNPMHPEFVIPTDPLYRGRALGLLSKLMDQLGMARGGRIPMLAPGDILDGIGDAIGGGIGVITGAAREAAVTTAMAPFLTAFDAGMRAIPGGGFGGAFKGLANYMKNTVYNALKGTPRGANGFLVNPSIGGTLIRAGEAGRREALVPLPSHMSADNFGNGATIVINGNLEFPNITSGKDADEFIQNLRDLSASH